jgi:hypothetical protein
MIHGRSIQSDKRSGVDVIKTILCDLTCPFSSFGGCFIFLLFGYFGPVYLWGFPCFYSHCPLFLFWQRYKSYPPIPYHSYIFSLFFPFSPAPPPPTSQRGFLTFFICFVLRLIASSKHQWNKNAGYLVWSFIFKL